MLVGSYEHNLDSKGRLALPAPFRKEIEGSDLIVVPSPTEKALFVFDPVKFELWLDSLFERSGGFNPRSRKDVAIRKRILGSSAPVVLDSAGRLSIPKQLRDYAALTKEVTVLGNYDHAELWDSACYAEHMAELSDADFEEFFFTE